jgi:hypothetical protein
MKRKIALVLILTLLLLPLNGAAQISEYGPVVHSGYTIIWDVEIATNFSMYYTGGGYCAVENDSTMAFGIGGVGEEVSGYFEIGNVSVYTNDTMIALDLALGIWPSWLTGLFVKVGHDNIETLNDTAYAAAERVSGNWMNGTMSSHYENITIGQDEYECIVFDYEQDPPGTQVTHVAYSLATGVLVEADTSVTFGSTFQLSVSLQEIVYPTPVDFSVNLTTMIVIAGIVVGGLCAVVVLVLIRQGRQ